MTLATTQDIFYLVAAIALGWVAVFLTWALYELAKLLHQANQTVTETREKITRVEKAVMGIKERLESSVGYLGMLAEGGRTLLSFPPVFRREKREAKIKEGEGRRRRRIE
jgi:hypothetical protein